MPRRQILPSECDHPGPILVDPIKEGYIARCLLCGTVGPEQETSGEALNALKEQGERNRDSGGHMIPTDLVGSA